MLSAWCGGVGAGCGVWVLTAALVLSTALAQHEPPGAQQEPPGAQQEPPGAQQEPPGAQQEPPGAQREPPGAPRCTHPRCKYIGHNIAYGNRNYYYEVEGNAITIIKPKSRPHAIDLHCSGNSVLESPALPRSTPAQLVYDVELKNCSLPATGSLGDSLATLNLTFCQHGPRKPCKLLLRNLQKGPRPAGKHFVGLERLQNLEISTSGLTDTDMRVTAKRNVLMALRNLRDLSITDSVKLPAKLDPLPPSLEAISLFDTDMKRLPKAIHSSASLQKLIFTNDRIPLNAVVVSPGMRELDVDSTATKLRLDTAPALEELQLSGWVEPLPRPISRCDKLLQISLKAPAMRALPHGWLANCSRLERLSISEAYNLITLPPLLSHNNQLKYLHVWWGALETLSEGALDDLRVLEELYLSNNHIKTLPKNIFKAFIHYSLSSLSLSSNNLDGSVLDTLEPLPQDKLTELDLSDNPRIGDFCSVDSYSPIRWFVNLRLLDLRNTSASRVCTDWREDLLDLELLDISRSNISELAYEDMQFTRTVRAQVQLSTLNPLSSLRITREDFNFAVGAPPSFTSVEIVADLECDCRVYWTRRVLDDPLARLSLRGFHSLRCVGGGLLRDLPAEELVCGAREECAAAALPPECACAARPEDDPTQDRWFVRARCKKNSQGFVPRRMYPFYPLHRSNNLGAYVTQHIVSIN